MYEKDAADLSIAKHVKLSQPSHDGVLRFICPANGCQYAENGLKHFTSNKLLKQHYMKMHAPKRYSCITCSASFGLCRDLTRHEKVCQKRIVCATCRVAFSTQDDLKSHCQLTQHEDQNTHVEVLCDKAGETSEREKLPANHDGDVSVFTVSELGTGVNPEQLQVKDASVPVFSNAAQQPASQQRNSNDTGSTDSNSASANSQHNSSTIVESHGSCEQSSADLSTSEAGVSHCHNSGDDSRRNLYTKSKSASVTVGVRVSKASSGMFRQSPIELLPKPMYTLLPIGSLVVVINAGTAHSSGSRRQFPAIAPRPADDVSSIACLPAVLREDSSAASCHDGDVLLHGKQQKSVSSVVTQTSMLPARPQCKTATAATQTSERFAPSRGLSKESRASQVSSKVRRKRPRDVQHSHTQTHGSNQKLRRITGNQSLGVKIPAIGTETPQWWLPDVTNQAALWPDVASNATQTVSHLSTKLESIRTQTVESFLSSSQQEDLLDIASKLLSNSVGTSCESSSTFAVVDNPVATTSSERATLSANMPEPLTLNVNQDLLEPGLMLNDISRQLVGKRRSLSDVTQTLQRSESAANGDYGVNCIGSQTLPPLVDELMNAIDDACVQGTASSSQLSRVMLTSASQTMPDFDAVSTQTMDCDFDGDIDIDDFDDFIHTETQTTDMLANYFSFADIETQTASDMQHWDSETQTCFDALLSPSHM